MKEILDEIINRLRVEYPSIDPQTIVDSSYAGYVYSIWLGNIRGDNIRGRHICILRYLYGPMVNSGHELSISWKDMNMSHIYIKQFDIYDENCFESATNLIRSIIKEDK